MRQNSQKTTRFGGYWLKVYKICGELRIDGGLNKHKDIPERQTTNMLASSDKQLGQIFDLGLAMALMAQELLTERRDDRIAKIPNPNARKPIHDPKTDKDGVSE